MTYHDRIICQCEKQLTFVNVSVRAKWAVQTLHSFEVNNFFEVFSHNFRVVDCAFFVRCDFIAEKSWKKSEQLD